MRRRGALPGAAERVQRWQHRLILGEGGLLLYPNRNVEKMMIEALAWAVATVAPRAAHFIMRVHDTCYTHFIEAAVTRLLAAT